MKQTGRNKRPLFLPVLAAAALLILAGGTAYRHLARNSLAVTLTDLSGDAGKIRGFTLNGRATNRRADYTVSFSLKGGYLENAVQLEQGFYQETNRIWYHSATAVAPGQRAEVDQELWGTTQSNDTFYRSSATKFWNMVTVVLPDGTRLRLKASEAESDEPREVLCTIRNGTSVLEDWVATEIWQQSALWPEGWEELNPTAAAFLNGAYHICWPQDCLLSAGIYRVDRSLTDEEVQALPSDGDILGTPCLCATTAYGAVSLFYRPKGVERVYNCCNLGDGLAVLYRNTSKTICLDLVDAAGRCTDHRELMPWDGDTALAAELLPRQRREDAAFVFTGGPDATARTLVIFRAAEGKLTHLESQTETLFPGGGTGEDIEAALFNQNGTAVMVVRSHNRQAALRDGSYTENVVYQDGDHIAVYEQLGGSMPVYTGLLDCGSARRWAANLAYGAHGMSSGFSIDSGSQEILVRFADLDAAAR